MSLQSVSRNPFFVDKPVPPEHFVGRTSEIAAAFDQIYNRSHLAIWGGPGMGKTSFLEKLADSQTWEENGLDPSQAVIVLLNCENISPFTPSGFWQEVLSLLKDKLDDKPTLQAEIAKLIEEGKTTKDSLRQILRKIGKQNRFLVLLVDDYDVALQENEQYTHDNMEQFLSECRNLAVHFRERQYFSMIVTSLRRLNELGPELNPSKSPWYNHYLFQRLKPFNNTEIAQLLSPLRTPEARDAIREIADGHPSLLQIAGFLLYIELETDKVPDSQAFMDDFESSTIQIFQNIWDRTNQVEQTLLMLIALSNFSGRLHQKEQFDLSGTDLIFSQKERELSKLEEQGVIVHQVNEQRTMYSFTSSIMERWVIQQVWNTDEESLKAREKVFLNLMSHKQAEKLTNAIGWLGQHKDDVIPILKRIPQGIQVLLRLFAV
ncbi:MAG: ATP-binding protein [Nostocaceae cyanobacterium]|nr:ATP-binding protein [Nostocaceae cyanobacterium]